MTYFIFLHESSVINTFTTQGGSLKIVLNTISKLDPIFKEKALNRLRDPEDLGFYFKDSPVQEGELEKAIRILKETLEITLKEQVTSKTQLLN